jgi:DMSO reductase anchor subunit
MMSIMSTNQKKNPIRQAVAAGFFAILTATGIAVPAAITHTGHAEKAAWGIINGAQDAPTTTMKV